MSASDSPDLPKPTAMIEKSRLSKELLFDIFQAAYMKPDIGSEGALWVNGRSGIPYIVTVDSYEIAFYMCYFFREDLDRNEKLELLNKLNATTGIARFSISEDSSPLDIECCLSIEEGLTPLQILNYLTNFDTEVARALDELEDSLDFNL